MSAAFYDAGGEPAPAFALGSLHGTGALDAREAIALLRGTIVAHHPLAEAPGALALREDAPAIVLDLAGADDALAHDSVAAIDSLAAARGWRVIVAFSVAQIDPVVAALGEEAAAVQLLCEPDRAEWIGALAVAAARGGGGGVRSPERDSERLARLSAEVARIAALLAQLSDGGVGLDRAEEPRRVFHAAPIAPVAISAAQLRAVVRARRLRDRFLGEGLFEDPAWDMLLDLYASHLERRRVSVSSLCIAAAVPPTTALRWITRLTERRLLARMPDPDDRRRVFIGLTDEAVRALQAYLGALVEAGLPLV
ncbi:winged helix DNA-binding protein [Sphingomonas yunnanensis]|uniref:winged helix DNA-binding protein n=1 Tax=Sphingomonas yunnanensis TaxID=310400 RepID=UPI001CA76682|nr:winged helix DNA-binding protein [Sphingomonas yunnanensis]MBY9064112.1 winged helix DNA-binding protein [Sphingomonas yunnanensis]